MTDGKERRIVDFAAVEINFKPQVTYTAFLLLLHRSRVTDKPHGITIWLSLGAMVISVVAACISGASWMEARKSRNISAAASKAIVSAISVKPETITWAYATSQLQITVLNSGRSLANNVIIKGKYVYTGAGGQVPEEPVAPQSIKALPPNASYNFSVQTFTDQHALSDQFAAKQMIAFELKGSILYRDTATDSTDEQPFCFRTWMKGFRLPVSTPFQPCNEGQKNYTIHDDPTP